MDRREIRKMHDESGTDALAIRIEREQLHPTRIDADQRLVGVRRQTRNRPVVTLGPARPGDAALAVAPEHLQDVLRLRATQQLLKARGVIEPQLKGPRALVGVSDARFAFYPMSSPLTLLKLGQ